MSKFMLIGGGEVGRGNTTYETQEIDVEVVKMTEKEEPNFLFVGLASSYADSYYDAMKAIYKSLGCECQYLKKKNIINNRNIVEEKISNADIIYIGGGDTIKLMNQLAEYDLSNLFIQAINNNTVVAGISAGAIMLCQKGYSDSLMLRNEADNYTFIDGLGIVDIIFSPHHSKEKQDKLKIDLENTNYQVYGLENGVALKIIDKEKSIVKSIKENNAYLINKDKMQVIE